MTNWKEHKLSVSDYSITVNSLLGKLYKHRHQIIFCQIIFFPWNNTILYCFAFVFQYTSLCPGKETIQSWIVFKPSAKQTLKSHSSANFHTTTSAVLVWFLKYLFCSAMSLPVQITRNSVTFFFPDSTRDLRAPDYTRDIQSLFNTFETAMDFCSSSTFLAYFLTFEQKLSAHSHPRIAYTVDMSITVFCTVYGWSFPYVSSGSSSPSYLHQWVLRIKSAMTPRTCSPPKERSHWDLHFSSYRSSISWNWVLCRWFSAVALQSCFCQRKIHNRKEMK